MAAARRRGRERRRAPRAPDISGRRRFSAAQAYDWGLAAKIVPAAELKSRDPRLAHRLAQNAPAARPSPRR